MTQPPVRQPELTQQITLSCLDPWGRSVDVPTTLGYRTDDPYAVCLTFHSPTTDVDWYVARALLQQGLAEPTGDGDVKVFPSIDEDARSVVILDFSSPDGRLIAEANAGEVRDFLTRTLDAVPSGRESEHLDLDSLLSDLLGSQAE